MPNQKATDEFLSMPTEREPSNGPSAEREARNITKEKFSGPRSYINVGPKMKKDPKNPPVK